MKASSIAAVLLVSGAYGFSVHADDFSADDVMQSSSYDDQMSDAAVAPDASDDFADVNARPGYGGGHGGGHGGGGYHPGPGHGGGGYHPGPGPGHGGGYHPGPGHYSGHYGGWGPGWHPGYGGHPYPGHYGRRWDAYYGHVGYYPWRHWAPPYWERPVYTWNWVSLHAVTCEAESSNGDVFPVTENAYVGAAYQAQIAAIEDAAIDRCYSETGGDEGCVLVACTPTY